MASVKKEEAASGVQGWTNNLRQHGIAVGQINFVMAIRIILVLTVALVFLLILLAIN